VRFSKLPKILPGMHEPVPATLADQEIAGVTHDSRRVKQGWVFVAICGHHRDGASFAEDAVARGAAAIVAERKVRLPATIPQFVVPDARRALAALANTFFGRASRRLQVVGVTGTNGKTTTTYMLRAIIEASGKRCGLLGTICYDTGRRNLPAAITTPESVDTQEFLSEMVNDGLEYAVMEVSSHALCMRRVDFVQFAAGIFTNLSDEHMDYHGSLNSYCEAKQQLFKRLGPCNYAVLNADDPASAKMAKATAAKQVWYGMRKAAEVTGKVRRANLNGIDISLGLGKSAIDIHVPLIGEHNAYNALGAAGAARALGIDLETIRDGLEQMPAVPGRLEPVPCAKGCSVLVDFAHTDHALKAVLKSLRKVGAKRILVVFGAGGDRDHSKRARMGSVVERGADLAWVTSDNPRSEDPNDIINEIVSGMRSRRRVQIQPDRQTAITEAISAARPGDLVLIAGKGHERTQRFKDTVIPFDDREAARQALTPAIDGALMGA